jgi:uncharacterized integral membrane protein
MKMSIRTWVALVLGFLSGVFVLQNKEAVDFGFLFWHSTMSLVILLGITLFAGIVIGFLVGWEVFSRRRKKKLEREAQVQVQAPPTPGS